MTSQTQLYDKAEKCYVTYKMEFASKYNAGVHFDFL